MYEAKIALAEAYFRQAGKAGDDDRRLVDGTMFARVGLRRREMKRSLEPWHIAANGGRIFVEKWRDESRRVDVLREIDGEWTCRAYGSNGLTLGSIDGFAGFDDAARAGLALLRTLKA